MSEEAPEGSGERAHARRVLLQLSMRALSDPSLATSDWLESLARSFPQLIAVVGERDMRAILGMCRRDRAEVRDAA